MLVKNIHINGREGLWQIAIEDGKIARILPNEEQIDSSGDILDGEQGIVYPPLLNRTFIWMRRKPQDNRTGTNPVPYLKGLNAGLSEKSFIEP